MDTEMLNEKIEKHDTLNQKLFDGDKLKDDVKESIIKIVNTFISELSNDGVSFKLKDILLIGSNVSYNYTEDSDLDIHLIADSSSLDCNPEIYTLLYSAYRSIFNNNYDISIKGIPVEIYVELDETKSNSNGVYSINNGWIKVPEQKEIPDIDMEEFEKQFKVWEDKYFNLLYEVGNYKNLVEDKLSEDNILTVYNATDYPDYSNFDISKELGIHCGTLAAASNIFDTRHYAYLNKLFLKNYHIIEASKDYEDIWDPVLIMLAKDNLLSPFSPDEIKELWARCNEINYPNKYERRGNLFRNALLEKGYNLIKYTNNVEDKGSTSYIILDNSIIDKFESVSDKEKI